MPAGELAARDRANHAVDVTYLERAFDLLATLDCRLADLEQLRRIERPLETMILRDRLTTANLGAEIRLIENVAEIEAVRLPMIDGVLHFKTVSTPDHFVNCAEAETRHDLAHLSRNEAHEVHDMLGLAREALAQARILCRYTCRTGV